MGRPSCGNFDKSKLNAIVMNRLKTFKKPDNFQLYHQEKSHLDTFSGEISSDYVLFPDLIFNYNLFDYGKNSSFDSQIINHSFLRDYLLAERKKTILIYNYHSALLNFFKQFNITMIDKYGNICHDSTNYEEAIVTNF